MKRRARRASELEQFWRSVQIALHWKSRAMVRQKPNRSCDAVREGNAVQAVFSDSFTEPPKLVAHDGVDVVRQVDFGKRHRIFTTECESIDGFLVFVVAGPSFWRTVCLGFMSLIGVCTPKGQKLLRIHLDAQDADTAGAGRGGIERVQ